MSRELAHFIGALAHSHRIHIIEELRGRELDVNSIQQLLGISHSAVSQNLAVLRAHRVVQERREGRHVFYSLTQPLLADWLLGGLQFLEREFAMVEEMRGALETVKSAWGSGQRSADRAES